MKDKKDEVVIKADLLKQLETLSMQRERLAIAKKGVVVLIEGMGETGKATLINKMISVIDPKYYSVEVMNTEKDDKRLPMLTKYFNRLPEYGSFTFFDTGWYTEVIREKFKGGKDYSDKVLSDIEYLEKSIRDNDYILFKVYLETSRSTQEHRIKKALKSKSTAWKISKIDKWENENFFKLDKEYIHLMGSTDETVFIDNVTKSEIALTAITALNKKIDSALDEKDTKEIEIPEHLKDAVYCDCVEYDSDEDYKNKLKTLQANINTLQDKLYKRGLSTVICFEGMDTAGKGGAIKRLTKTLDPRTYKIYPTSAPTVSDKNKHFLYRFWNKLPKSGHISIFDRTWYGRVLVERVDKLCSEKDYMKAYSEIVNFEKYLSDNKINVIKIYLDISKDEQLSRLTARQDNPKKRWKLTDEDWKNREKWNMYAEATKVMFSNTSTENAEWHIVKANNKKEARLTVLQLVCDSMEKMLDNNKK